KKEGKERYQISSVGAVLKPLLRALSVLTLPYRLQAQNPKVITIRKNRRWPTRKVVESLALAAEAAHRKKNHLIF
ncbi:MAG: hypothetical protein OXI58_07515, partial [Gemmatimonadota bacterium]|nr:hypothetical protein [Gemmatimonadota bacterium]